MAANYLRYNDSDVHKNDAEILEQSGWMGRTEAGAYALGFLRGVKVAQAVALGDQHASTLFDVLAQNIRARAAITGDTESGL